MQGKDALLIIDMQNDFCPGGALAVTEGDRIIPILNQYIEKFRAAKLPILATRDWHPERTKHFKAFGGLWPPHCIQGTKGAEFHPALAVPEEAVIISAGMGDDEEGYSGFDGIDAEGVKLIEVLRHLAVERLFVGGLATDYCVRHTILDALNEGFQVVLIEDAVRGVNLKPDDAARAVQEMIQAGATRA
jgi:nicotinamidase/pyrazinamidase